MNLLIGSINLESSIGNPIFQNTEDMRNWFRQATPTATYPSHVVIRDNITSAFPLTMRKLFVEFGRSVNTAPYVWSIVFTIQFQPPADLDDYYAYHLTSPYTDLSQFFPSGVYDEQLSKFFIDFGTEPRATIVDAKPVDGDEYDYVPPGSSVSYSGKPELRSNNIYIPEILEIIPSTDIITPPAYNIIVEPPTDIIEVPVGEFADIGVKLTYNISPNTSCRNAVLTINSNDSELVFPPQGTSISDNGSVIVQGTYTPTQLAVNKEIILTVTGYIECGQELIETVPIQQSIIVNATGPPIPPLEYNLEIRPPYEPIITNVDIPFTFLVQISLQTNISICAPTTLRITSSIPDITFNPSAITMNSNSVFSVQTTYNPKTVVQNLGVTIQVHGSLICGSETVDIGAISDIIVTALPYICFAKGTIISTNKGDIPIEELQTGMVVNGNRVLKLLTTSIVNTEITLIKKDSIELNVPNKDTFITPRHRISVNDEMIKAGDYKNGIRIKCNKNIMYNLLMAGFEVKTMKANNMLSETMCPKALRWETGYKPYALKIKKN